MKCAYALIPVLLLSACATPGKFSGELSSYDGLQVKEGALRTSVARRSDRDRLSAIGRIAIEPTRILDQEASEWLTAKERDALSREIDAQLCFELTERFPLAGPGENADAKVRAVVTRVAPTGRTASAFSAASGFFIPGPIGLRVPGTTGGLGAEAEMIDAGGRQLAAVVWNRNATAIGTDDPSLSRIGDALQFAEPFADAVGASVTPEDHKSRKIEDPDPCRAFGPRFRPEGWLTSFATGLYIPEASGARPDKDSAEDETPKADRGPETKP